MRCKQRPPVAFADPNATRRTRTHACSPLRHLTLGVSERPTSDCQHGTNRGLTGHELGYSHTAVAPCQGSPTHRSDRGFGPLEVRSLPQATVEATQIPAHLGCCESE